MAFSAALMRRPSSPSDSGAGGRPEAATAPGPMKMLAIPGAGFPAISSVWPVISAKERLEFSGGVSLGFDRAGFAHNPP